jgi:tetratricopeptide (TPR) repeat protein
VNPILDNARQLYFDGNVGATVSALRDLQKKHRADPLLLQQIAGLFVQCGQHEQAAQCYRRAVDLQPGNPDYLYNLATSKTAMGDLDEAEDLFTEVIRLKPDDYGAWLNRSGLKTQTAESNHVKQLKYVKSHLGPDDPDQIQVCYALSKELEDLGRHDESFPLLQEGSHRRRQTMQYDIVEDENAMSSIADCFDAELLNSVPVPGQAERPVFILGLPRSGTTLVDRIISSHSRADSLGEHNTLALALMRMTRELEEVPGADATGKAELIRRSVHIDLAELGRRYAATIDEFGNPSERLIDKTPLNFLYLGLIRLAMPGARIIHMRRHPMDSCYAIYKTLFRSGYPFSYSLQEVGRYFIAYRRLMDHWRNAVPGFFLDVDYESVVMDPEGSARRIIDYLDLDWEQGCLEFHRRRGVAATASAAQVRRPIYSSSVGLWRKYERQLAPLAGKLHERGIGVD